MLYTNTVESNTLELLIDISKDTIFNDFFLVGGTSLSLQIGHRKSIDLDFFSLKPFDCDILSERLINNYKAIILSVNTNAITCRINNVKVDFISHQYPLLDNIRKERGIRLSSLKDIAAMKINAIKNRGTKKDFVDIYFLLKYFSMQDLLSFSRDKYPNHIDLLILKSLVYFKDADIHPDCDLVENVDWDTIKQQISKHTNKLL